MHLHKIFWHAALHAELYMYIRGRFGAVEQIKSHICTHIFRNISRKNDKGVIQTDLQPPPPKKKKKKKRKESTEKVAPFP